MIIVTGATGLLGQVIVNHLTKNGKEVIPLYRNQKPKVFETQKCLEADINDVQSLISAFKGASTVVHAAALVSFNKKDKEALFKVNVDGTANVVNACLESGVKRLIHISSVAALGKPQNHTLINETTPWSISDAHSNYGLSKKLAEQEVFRGEAEGLSVAVLNPSVILSQGNFERSSGRLFDYVNKENLFYTTGHLNYVDARDIALLVEILASQNQIKGRFIANAGHINWKLFFEQAANRLKKRPPKIGVQPKMVYLAALVEAIKSSLTGKEPLVTFESARIANQTRVYDNRKSLSELNFQYRTLNETLDWCCDSAKRG